MTRARDPYIKQSQLNADSEPTLRWRVAYYTEEAERHERAAAVARENACRCFEAADAKAAAKRARKEQRRMRHRLRLAG